MVAIDPQGGLSRTCYEVFRPRIAFPDVGTFPQPPGGSDVRHHYKPSEVRFAH